ncbi:ubiquitin carboxyl-terminal hydrolase 47-like [Poeciliopsis prolifica]|uniref:ubiquitin carboxyl-terminal hydrolase 47-like n=1 Tax=Poeciliopsis prolifica TaxID=188132 RepID=UPI0024143EDC|nr:ubiquitin carboxyl-terminal hydrolase 47-like [Poeciliopsis prolifica]XP_054916352.1 ubiquitin carboxyl-terminal hydrolase 47-like [Poeciliopsis prolifica]
MPRCPNLDSKYGSINHYTVMKFREKLDNLSISDYQGLSSPGLTCYLNSILQVLFMTEEFREAVKRDWSKSSTATIDFYLGELFHTLEGDMAKTHNITKKLGIKDVFEQRDAAEYLEKILCRTNPNASKIFKGELNHKTTCLNCNNTNISTNFFWVLPLSMGDSKSGSYSVLKGWRSFFKSQRVCKENQMFCSRCNQKHDADIEYEMMHCPDVLTLLLKRFSFDYQQNRYVKLNGKVDVAQTLEIKNCRYDLYAVVHHFGDLMGGHYTADIKSFETGNWYCFNDNTVKCINEVYVKSGQNQIRSSTVYLLMYKMVSGRPKETDGSSLEDRFLLSPEAEDRCNEAEPKDDFVFEDLLKTESHREDMWHLNNMIRDDEFKKKHPNSSRRGNEQLNGKASQRKPEAFTTEAKDSKEQICYNNTNKSSDCMFHQSSTPPIKGGRVNESRDKQGNYKTNKHLHYHSPIRGRVESGGTTDVFFYGEDSAVASTHRNGLTVTKRTCSNGGYSSDLSKILEKEKPRSPSKRSQTKKQLWK